jgi:integrase
MGSAARSRSAPGPRPGRRRSFSSCSGTEMTGTYSVVRPTPCEMLSSHGSHMASPDARSRRSSIGPSLLTAAQRQPAMYAYIVLSLLTGARTEELRALTWSHVDLDGEPPSVQLWRSVREGGDTKTRLSRRTLELPNDCVVALRAHRRWQTQSRMRSASRWPDNDLVFTTQRGTPLDAANVRRALRQIAKHAGLHAEEWTPRESCGTVSSRCC